MNSIKVLMSMHCVWDPMIQNIILRQIGLAHDKIQNNAIQETNCVFETPYKGPSVFGSHEQNMILPQIGLAQDKIKKNTPYRKPSVLEMSYRETTVLLMQRSNILYYYLKFSMWLKTIQNGMIASQHILINFQCTK